MSIPSRANVWRWDRVFISVCCALTVLIPSTPVQSETDVSQWLRESRVIGVVAVPGEAEPVTPMFWTLEPMGERADRGGTQAVDKFWRGAEGGIFFLEQLLALIVVTPGIYVVGSLSGAADEARVENGRELTENSEVEKSLRQATGNLDIAAAIREHVIELAKGKTRHELIVISSEEERSDPTSTRQFDTMVKVELQALGVAADKGNEEEIRLRYSMSASVWLNAGDDFTLADTEYVQYLGKKDEIAVWSADNSALLRDELYHSFEVVGEEIVSRLLLPTAEEQESERERR